MAVLICHRKLTIITSPFNYSNVDGITYQRGYVVACRFYCVGASGINCALKFKIARTVRYSNPHLLTNCRQAKRSRLLKLYIHV